MPDLFRAVERIETSPQGTDLRRGGVVAHLRGRPRTVRRERRLRPGQHRRSGRFPDRRQSFRPQTRHTGADGARRGLVREAEGGALSMDEIGDIGKEAQVKLFRFLQGGDYYPLASDRPERRSARIVMATNADLQAKVRAGAFRRISTSAC